MTPPLIIATILREEGTTGVHTHVRQLRQYLHAQGQSSTLLTPFSWGYPCSAPVFGARLAVERCSRTASVQWYRHWHEVFLHQALRRRLAEVGECVVYAQGPLAARAALRARRGPDQRVIMAVHFRISQADEWADKKQIASDGVVFHRIRELEREVIPRLDGAVYVSRWARDALLNWLPEAAAVPSAVIFNFVASRPAPGEGEPAGDLVTTGGLEIVKNHAYLLRILAEARQAGRALTLDIFGDGPLRRDLEHQALSLGLQAQVRFRGFRSDVGALLPRYRAYVHASYSESSSFAIIEAMNAGLPIVTGGIGPIGELCEDGVEGRFWALDHPAHAAETLLSLLDNEPARRRAAAAARDRFGRDFDADVVAPRLLTFLSDCPAAYQAGVTSTSTQRFSPLSSVSNRSG